MTVRAMVLDASALIAYARNEAGATAVGDRLRTGDEIIISSVNWAEVVGKLRQFGMSPTILRQALSAVDARILPFDETDADVTGELAVVSGGMSLSIGDRACIAVSSRLGASAVTADRAWSKLRIPDLRVDLIR